MGLPSAETSVSFFSTSAQQVRQGQQGLLGRPLPSPVPQGRQAPLVRRVIRELVLQGRPDLPDLLDLPGRRATLAKLGRRARSAPQAPPAQRVRKETLARMVPPAPPAPRERRAFKGLRARPALLQLLLGLPDQLGLQDRLDRLALPLRWLGQLAQLALRVLPLQLRVLLGLRGQRDPRGLPAQQALPLRLLGLRGRQGRRARRASLALPDLPDPPAPRALTRPLLAPLARLDLQGPYQRRPDRPDPQGRLAQRLQLQAPQDRPARKALHPASSNIRRTRELHLATPAMGMCFGITPPKSAPPASMSVI